jgi:hypothetical protein
MPSHVTVASTSGGSRCTVVRVGASNHQALTAQANSSAATGTAVNCQRRLWRRGGAGDCCGAADDGLVATGRGEAAPASPAACLTGRPVESEAPRRASGSARGRPAAGSATGAVPLPERPLTICTPGSASSKGLQLCQDGRQWMPTRVNGRSGNPPAGLPAPRTHVIEMPTKPRPPLIRPGPVEAPTLCREWFGATCRESWMLCWTRRCMETPRPRRARGQVGDLEDAVRVGAGWRACRSRCTRLGMRVVSPCSNCRQQVLRLSSRVPPFDPGSRPGAARCIP